VITRAPDLARIDESHRAIAQGDPDGATRELERRLVVRRLVLCRDWHSDRSVDARRVHLVQQRLRIHPIHVPCGVGDSRSVNLCVAYEDVVSQCHS
jgi:hypothetical protein